jgi:hypothetical protein
MKQFDRDEISATVRDRAESDAAFRAQLLADPSAAMAELIGMPVPQGVRITVHEESPADIHLVIAAESALNDSDLELVAGGIDWSVTRPPVNSCDFSCDG